MDARLAKQVIAVVKAEKARRGFLLRDEEPNAAYDQWIFTDIPFLNEICLMLLVAVWHQVEKELVRLAARATDDVQAIDQEKYKQEVQSLVKKKTWKKIERRLKLEDSENYRFLQVLRLLANSYKHDPSSGPAKGLLKVLGLDPDLDYAELPESSTLQEGLAAFVRVPRNADYCEIAETFVDLADRFLVDVKSRTKLSRVRGGRVGSTCRDQSH